MADGREPIEAPGVRLPRYSLLVVAGFTEDSDLRALGAGWKFLPNGCPAGGRLAVTCQGNTAAMGTFAEDSPAVIVGDPFYVFAPDKCSTLGWRGRDWQERARRTLRSIESHEVAHELWTGDLSAAENLDNRSLAGVAAESDTVTDGPTAEVPAMGCLEQAWSTEMRGQQGMIHVTVQLLTQLVAAQWARRDGAGANAPWVSPMGNLIVADSGYDGSGPGGVAAGDSQWAYATPYVSIRLGPVEVTPRDMADARQLAEVVTVGTNDMLVFAGRMAGYQWANYCGHFAAEVDLPVCLPGGAS